MVSSLMQVPNTLPIESDRPTIVQGSSVPVFVGGGYADFACHNCGHILAKDYNKRSLIAIDIECFRCNNVSRTEEWPLGEVMPARVATMGRGRARFLIGSPVLLHGGAAFSCDAEIDRVRSLTSVAPECPSELDLTVPGLELFEAEINILTGNEFAKMMAAAKRARDVGNLTFTKCPPAWAMQHLKSKANNVPWALNGADNIAIGYLFQLRHFIDRWQHHYLFGLVARSLCSEFHHAMTMLLAASMLSDAGNEIGITNMSTAIGRSPDLYINTFTDRRISIEVKAPNLFFWPSPQLSVADMERQIHRVLRSARDQLTGQDGGVVVLGASGDGEYRKDFEKAIKNVARSGKVSTRIAAIYGVLHYFSAHPADGLIKFDMDAVVSVETNPRYPGVNPVRLGK
jgi:hypothetical protein